MVEIVAGIVVALAVGIPHGWAERRGTWPVYLATWLLVIGGVVGLFLFGDALLIETDNPLLLLGYVAGIVAAQQLATRWWGRERFWRRPPG
jgi:hypothetical protein